MAQHSQNRKYGQYRVQCFGHFGGPGTPKAVSPQRVSRGSRAQSEASFGDEGSLKKRTNFDIPEVEIPKDRLDSGQ